MSYINTILRNNDCIKFEQFICKKRLFFFLQVKALSVLFSYPVKWPLKERHETTGELKQDRGSGPKNSGKRCGHQTKLCK